MKAYENGVPVAVDECSFSSDEQEPEYTESQYREVLRRLLTWITKTRDGCYCRALAAKLFLMPDELGNPSQRDLAATNGVLVASLNRMVREFEKEFHMRIPGQKSDHAKMVYSFLTKKRHQKNKCKTKTK